MSQVVSLRRVGDDTLWAVVASIGRKNWIAEIFSSRPAALADRDWREQPAPRYSVTPVRRTDLPKGWKPLPALGFLRGKFV